MYDKSLWIYGLDKYNIEDGAIVQVKNKIYLQRLWNIM